MKEGFTVPSTARLTGNLARVRRYRAMHRRIDYVPSFDVLPIIQHHLKMGTDPCLAGVIDYLVRSGHHAITGNGGDVDEVSSHPQIVNNVESHRS